jgi:predicted aspartyl protease
MLCDLQAGGGSMRGNRFLLAMTGAALFAVPAAAAECGPLKIVTSLPIRPAPGGSPVVDVQIADTPQTLLVDTGGVVSVITPDLVKTLKLPTTRAKDGVEIKTARGATSDMMVRLPSITIGNLRQEGAYFYVFPEPRIAGGRAAGLLAPDFLQNFDADFDFQARKLNLISPDHCAGKVVYWTAPAVAIVPMRLDRGAHITFSVELDGKRMDAMIDTGASNTILTQNVARSKFAVDLNGPDVKKLGEIKGPYTANVYLRKFKTLAFEGVVINDPDIVLMPDFFTNGVKEAPDTGSLVRPDPGISPIILGMSVLSKLHVYIAYKERKVYITAAGAEPAAATPAP